MAKRIIFQTEDGGVAIITPTPEALAALGINAIAKKDVPAGKKYKIIEDTDLPADRSTRSAWTVNEADLTDGVGGVQ
jgi:hypothetical protein